MYKRVYAKNVLLHPDRFFRSLGLINVKRGRKHKDGSVSKPLSYIRAYCGFDIETYTVPENHHAYMYIWQLSFYGQDNFVILGRTWEEFTAICDAMAECLHLSENLHLIVWDANLGYEMQFFRHRFRWTSVFAKEIRKPIYAITDSFIEFRDPLMITGGSLKALAKEFTQTQKLVGGQDLDYSIPRNSKTVLSHQEEQYCINDVVILAEYSKYIFDNYIETKHYIPLTKTGLLRKQVKDGCCKKAKDEIYRCYPPTKDLYDKFMLWCFRGGYTHGNIIHMGVILEGWDGWDITSSYPFAMIGYTGFPVSPFTLYKGPDTIEQLIEKDYCIIFHVDFYNVRNKTNHAIESTSKCLFLSDRSIIDNGRIRKTEHCELWLTELDYQVWCQFYDFRKEVHEIYIAKKGRLPRYVLDPICTAYKKKHELKAAGLSGSPEYALAKAFVNSGYGMMVSRMVIQEIGLDERGDWTTDTTQFNYEIERQKAFLLPQWGIYCTAYARKRLLDALYLLGDDGIYCDTDSIKHFNNHDELFENLNKEARAMMIEACAHLDLDLNVFGDLGSWDKEYTNAKGKFLGAKRYIIEEDGHIKSTIAGLPKNSLEEYCKKTGKNPYDVFSDKMLMSMEYSGKTTTKYNDLPHQDVINGMVMYELSSVGIYDIPFTMKLSQVYAALLLKIHQEGAKYETRIY